MNSRRPLIAVLFSMLAFTGCATMSPLVNLHPAAPATVPSFKNNPAVFLTVEDARADKSLGTLPAGPDVKGTSTQPVVPIEEVVRQHVTEALTRSGFQVLSTSNGNAPQLTVQVKKFEFKMEQLGASSQINGIGSLSVTSKAGTSTHTKNYNAENGKKWAFSPPANGHEQYMNDLLTDLLNAFLTDEAFLSSLTTPQ